MKKPTLNRLAQLSSEAKHAQRMNEHFTIIAAKPCVCIIDADDLSYLLECAAVVHQLNRLQIKDQD